MKPGRKRTSSEARQTILSRPWSEYVEKFCGGKGGKPGPCPKGSAGAHRTMRAHAGAAGKAAERTAGALAKAEAAHAKSGGDATAAKLAAAKDAHGKAAAKAARLGAKADALEKRGAKSAKPGAKVAGKAPANSPAKPARSFGGAKEAHTWGHDNYDKWAASLSKDEYKAVGRYLNDTYRPINDGLRASGGKPPPEHAAAVKLIDGALARGRTPEDIVVHRGLGAGLEDKLVPGGEFVDHGFGSTSLANGAADNYGAKTIMHIKVPKGSKGAYATAIMKNRGSPGTEQEFLLPRGTKYRVSSVKDVGGIKHVEAEVVSDAKHAERFSENPSSIAGCEVFATGTHRGKTYTRDDLADMVRNFRRHSVGDDPALRVPAVLGHEETQEFLDRSDIPAAAWAERAYLEDRKGRDGKPQTVLKVDFADVAPQVAALLRGRRYRKVSAEVYDDPPDGVSGSGKMLRRVAFLGGDIPQVKSLADIPIPHSEFDAKFRPVALCFREWRRTAGGFACFSEVRPMNRDEMLAQLGEMGVDVSAITPETPDAVLAEWLRSLTGGGDDDGGVAGEDGDAGDIGDTENLGEDGDADDVAKNSDDEDAKPSDPAKLAEWGKRMAEKYCGDKPNQMADATMPNAPKKVTTTQHFGEKLKAIEAKLKAADEKVEKLDKFAEARIAADTRARIDGEIKAAAAAGRILPAEIDAGKYEYLYDLPATGVVKFAENGKQVSGSPLDKALAAIRSGPVLIKFGEKFRDPKGAAAPDEEVAKVERFSEQLGDSLKTAGTTPAGYVEKFKELRKKKPALTAAEYGVPANV